MHLARRLERLRKIAREESVSGALGYSAKWLAQAAWLRLRFFWRFVLCDRRGLPILFLKMRYTRPVDDRFPVFGNYVLFRDELDENAVVYSFGIGRNITFDRAVAARFGCRVHAFDPTPLAIRYMAGVNHPLIVFAPVGLWVEDTKMAFAAIRGNSGEFASGSITNIHGFKDVETFLADVKCLETIMKENGHTHINILKMDIEGAALPVIRQVLARGIHPDQIVAEFEAPAGAGPGFFRELGEVLSDLGRAGYDLASLPARLTNMNFSIELVASRRRGPAL